MSLNLEVWQEGLKDVWLDPTAPGRYDNPELYDCPLDHGGIIHVMRGEYAFTSLKDEFFQLGTSIMGPFHFPLMIFEPETSVGCLALPYTFIDYLDITSIISAEIGGVDKRENAVICFDQRLPRLFETQVNEMAQTLQRSAEIQELDFSLEKMEEKLRKIGPLYCLSLVFQSAPRLIACDFSRVSAFKIDLRKIIPYLGFIESGKDLVSCLEKPPASFMNGLLLEKNVKQRMNLHQEMRKSREPMPICVYQSSALQKV